ncbi:MAG: hypothetical protein ACI8S6_002854 [Myxococcota bacterium]|jgi:hypothetical protein
MLHLEETELQDLAMFFARRFPDAERRVPLLAAARLNEPPDGSDAVVVWAAILADVQTPRQLRALTLAAQQLAPDDENLQDVCSILQPPPSRLGSAVAIASGVACALIVAALVVPAMRAPSAAADAVAPAASFVSAVATTPAPDAIVATNITPPRANLQIISKAPTSRNDANPEPQQEAAEPVPASTSTPTPTSTSTSSSGRCRADEGELIGYWYAGAEAPGAAGETISAPITANVRADYPDTHNGYNARAKVRCLILIGDRITLSSAPIAVPGERYWVPLRGGDIR